MKNQTHKQPTYVFILVKLIGSNKAHQLSMPYHNLKILLFKLKEFVSENITVSLK